MQEKLEKYHFSQHTVLSSSSELMSSEANPPSGDSEIDFDSGSCTPYTKAWTTITYWTVQLNKDNEIVEKLK